MLNQIAEISNNLQTLIGVIVVLVAPGIATLLSSTRVERTLYSKELRFLFYIMTFSLVFIIFPISCAYYSFNVKDLIYHYINNYFLINLAVIVCSFFAIIFIYFRLKKIVKGNDEPGRFEKFEFVIYYILSVIYISHLFLTYGYFILSIYISKMEYITYIIFTILYFLLLVPLFAIGRRYLKSEIKVDVTLINGDVIKNVYLLHQTLGKKILLSNVKKAENPYHQIVIPKSHVLYIEFYVTSPNSTKSLNKIKIIKHNENQEN